MLKSIGIFWPDLRSDKRTLKAAASSFRSLADVKELPRSPPRADAERIQGAKSLFTEVKEGAARKKSATAAAIRCLAAAALAAFSACASTSAPHDPVQDLPQLTGRRSLSFRGARAFDIEILAQDVAYANGTRASTVAGLYRQGPPLDVKVVLLADAFPNALNPSLSAVPELPTDLRFESTGMRVDVLSFMQLLRSNEPIDVPPCRDKEALHGLLSVEAPELGRGEKPYFRLGEIVCVLPLEARPR